MSDRETLSALLDGELQGEARLFAMRRLGHDAQWQKACGRWQLAGDVMRRQRTGPAPAGFAERVQQAVALETRTEAAASPVATAPAKPARRLPMRWMGGAIAASLAMVAALVTQPFGDGADPAPTVVARTQPTPTQRPAALPSLAAADPVVASVPQPAPVTSTPVDAAASTRPVDGVAAARPQRGPSAARTVAVRRAEPAAPAESAPALAAAADNPFSLSTAQSLESRPWPRAALIGQANGSFTVGYGSGSESRADAPSFYPFEPRPEGETGGTPAP